MRVVRRSVFETNSSASHSIVVLKEDNKNIDMFSDFKLDEDGYIAFSERDLTFNRSPFRILTTFADKVRFAIASIPGYPRIFEDDNDDLERAYRFNEITTIVKKYIINDDGFSNFSGFLLPCHYEISFYDKKTGEAFYGKTHEEEYVDSNEEKKIRYYGTNKENDDRVELEAKATKVICFGYIESYYDLLPFFLKNHNISLEEFLTSSRYFVVIDGDEYNIWDKFREMDLVDEDAIDYED